jgi:hypothetical protein
VRSLTGASVRMSVVPGVMSARALLRKDGENAEERPIFDVFHDFMFVVLVMFVVLRLSEQSATYSPNVRHGQLVSVVGYWERAFSFRMR